MRKHKTKKRKSTKSKISNSNKNHINITIHNSEKKHKRATRSKKGEAYQAPTQNPKGFTNTVTAGAPPAKNYQDDPKEKAAVENYNNRKPLEIGNEAHNPLIEKVHMLENGNNALHQQFQDFKTGVQTQGNALYGEIHNLKQNMPRTPLKILDVIKKEEKKRGRPKKEPAAAAAVAEPVEPVVKKAVGRPKKAKDPEPEVLNDFKEHNITDHKIVSTPEGAPQENQLSKMSIPSDSRKPKIRQPQKVDAAESPSNAQQSIYNVLYRGANFLNTDRANNTLTPVLKEQAMNDLYNGLMKEQEVEDSYNGLMEDLYNDVPVKTRKPRKIFTPS
jgi:hypothetical protein